MKAFVTGGTGFVGAHLVRRLEARGDDVTCLVRSPEKARALGWDRTRIVRGDLDDAAALREGCAGADVVYHVAGRISGRDLNDFMAANRDGTANVLEAAAEQPPQRFVLVSSFAAAGPSAPGAPIDETRPPAPVTDYGRSKLAAEVLVKNMPFPWTIVRPPVVYGEWDREVLKLFRMARTGVAVVIGDGSQELSLIYAGDLADALWRAGTSPGAVNRVYFAVHPRVVTSRSFAVAIARAVRTGAGDPWVLPVPGPLARGVLWTIGTVVGLTGGSTLLTADKANEFLAPAWTARADALARDTGWRAETDLEMGLARTAAWYREKGWL